MDYKILKHQEKAFYKGERLHILEYPGICQIFIFACICADAFTLFSTFDLLLTQQIYITWVITITVASVMNIIPMLLAANLQNDELSKKRKTVSCILLGSVFFLLFAATFSLRYTSREQMYTPVSNLNISIQDNVTEQTEVTENEETHETTMAQDILAIILGLEPLATSICTFALSFGVSPKRKKRHLMALRSIELIEEINHDRVVIEELKADMNYNLVEYDEKQYEEIVAVICQQGELAKIRAIRKLAEHVGTPEGISYLLEEEYLEEQKTSVLSDKSDLKIAKSAA